MVNYQQSHLDLAFSALAHPIRRGILARLASGETTVADLARPHDVSAPAITKHLQILEKAGLLRSRKDGRRRRCRLDARRLREAQGWIEHYRRSWERRLDRLDAYLKVLKEQETPHDPR
jgi:DNA-binding transcriptional ArsR family regulator